MTDQSRDTYNIEHNTQNKHKRTQHRKVKKRWTVKYDMSKNHYFYCAFPKYKPNTNPKVSPSQ